MKKQLTALVASGAVFTGCAPLTPKIGPETAPGNEFTIRAEIASVEIPSGTLRLKETEVQVMQGVGKAATWFTTGKGQDLFSDEYKIETSYFSREGWGCQNRKTVSQIYDARGDLEAVKELLPGQTVDIEGAIMVSSKKKGKRCRTQDWAVATTIKVTNETLAPTLQAK
ncbi:MAG: hypothetical protein WBO35_03570 [Candidatus Saccharimonadales bacterium]|jgi:hypothetical protein